MSAHLLRSSLESILAIQDAFPARFYAILFERHPELRSMFHRSSPGAQQKMFVQKLCAIVDHVDDPLWLERELAHLVDTHRAYGVRDEMYPWVGDALIQALREGLGDELTPEVEQSWRSAYATITELMLRASR